MHENASTEEKEREEEDVEYFTIAAFIFCLELKNREEGPEKDVEHMKNFHASKKP